MSGFYGGSGNLDQVARIFFETNPQALRDATQEAHRLEAEMAALAARGPAANQTFAQFTAELMAVQGALNQTRQVMAAMSDGFIKNSGAAARAMLDLSRAVEDFAVAGPLGALNNIPGIMHNVAQAFGLPLPMVNVLVTAVSLFGTAAYIAYRNWDSLMNAMGNGKIATEAEQMEELGKKTSKTAGELEKYLALKEREAEMDAQMKGKSEAEREQKKQVGKAIDEGGDVRIRTGLVQSAADEITAMDREARDAAEAVARHKEALKTTETLVPETGDSVSSPKTPEQYAHDLANDPEMKRLELKRQETLISAAKRLMADAALDPDKLAALTNLVNKSPGSFPRGFADQLGAASPEGQAETKEIEKELKDVEQAVGDRLHKMIRAAHDAIKDDTITPGERVEKVQGVIDELNKTGFVGRDVGHAREQLEDLLSGAKKGHAAEIDAAERKAEDASNALGKDLSNTALKGLSRELANVVATNADPGRRIAGIQGLAERAGKVELSPADRETIQQSLLVALHAAQNARGRADAQGEKKVDAAAEAASKKLGPGFEKQIQAETLENQLRVDFNKLHGLPVSSTLAEFESNRQMGNLAVTPELMKGMHARDVGVDLQRAGVNPALAPRVVQHATDKLAPMMANASRQMSSTGDTLVDNQAMLAQVLQGVLSQQAQLQARANQVNGTIRNLRRRGPSGWPANK